MKVCIFRIHTTLSREGLPAKLKSIEGELVDLRSKFTEKDDSIED